MAIRDNRLHELEPQEGEAVTEASSRFAFWVSLGLLAMGLAFTALTFWQFSREMAFVKAAKTAPAVIIDFVEDTGDIGKDDTVYRPVLQFTAEDGKSYTLRSDTGYSAGVQRLGEASEVLYLPSDPQQAQEKGLISNFISIVLGVLAAIFVALGCLGVYLSWRGKD
jgi:hypothetical protein